MKKSKATIAAEQEAARQVSIRAALRWTDDSDVRPDVPPPPSSLDTLTTGWTINVHARRVSVACSSSISHAEGRTDKTTTQRPIWLYSTKERALRALRCALEKEFAEELAKVDALPKGGDADD